jgi:hypothetical protein
MSFRNMSQQVGKLKAEFHMVKVEMRNEGAARLSILRLVWRKCSGMCATACVASSLEFLRLTHHKSIIVVNRMLRTNAKYQFDWKGIF